MIITSLELAKVGIHESRYIQLQRGVNAILGPVGSGKSTIIQAIGAGLFLSRVPTSLVSEGMTAGGIDLRCVVNQQDITLCRTIGKGSRWTMSGADGPSQPSGVADIRDWLRRELHLPDDIDMDTLWEQAIAVPQGTHTAALLQQVAQRKAYFGHLLGVGESTRIWEAMAPAARLSSDEVASSVSWIDFLHGALSGADDRAARRDSLLSRKVTATQTWNDTAAAAATARARHRAAVQAYALADKAKEIHDAAKVELDRLRELEAAARKRLEKKEILDAQLLQLAPSADAYRAALAVVEQHKDLRDQATEHRRIITAAPQETERLDAAIARCDQVLAGANKAKAELDLLIPMRERARSLESQLGKLLQSRGHRPKLTPYAAQIELIQDGINRAHDEQREIAAQIDRIVQGHGTCPTCGHVLPPGDPVADAQLASFRQRKNMLDAWSSKEKTKLTEIQSQERDAKKVIAEDDALLARVECLRSGLELLPDESQRISDLQATIAERPSAERERTREIETKAAWMIQLSNANIWMMDHSRALQDLAGAQDKVTKFIGDYERYITTAAQLEEYRDARQACDIATEAMYVAGEASERTRRDMDSLATEAAQHGTLDSVAAALANADSAAADARSDLASIVQSITAIEGAIAQDRDRAATLVGAEDHLSWLRDRHDRLESMRGYIRMSGPMVVRRRVAQVEQLAQRYYCDILGRTETIRWDPDDYGLASIHAEIERPFERHSGGERMALSLALRLGLVHSLLGSSALRLLILDEPTDGLGQEDRVRLAEQLMALVDWYTQVIVISHDSTFDALGAHVVHLGG